MESLNFQQSLFQNSVSLDPLEVILKSWFGAQEAFFFLQLLSQLKMFVLLNMYVKTMIRFSGLFDQ